MPPQAASSEHGMKKKPTPNVSRQQLINCYNRESDYKYFATSIGVNLKTTNRILVQYVKAGKTEASPKGGKRHLKVDDEMRGYLYQTIKENPAITLKKMNENIRRD